MLTCDNNFAKEQHSPARLGGGRCESRGGLVPLSEEGRLEEAEYGAELIT